MRVLVIAYEFPPSPSPQSLRWMHLSGELAALGVDVHVLTVDPVPTSMLRSRMPDGVKVHRTFPGLVVGGIAWLARRRRPAAAAQADGQATSAGMAQVSAPPRLNWKGRLVESIQHHAARMCFPDLRGEWRPFARRRLHQLLRNLQPDVVISSHEPATTLQLGALARAKGYPWLADLGDPVLSFYTPPRWRELAMRVEGRTCRDADRVTVTTEGARSLLVKRHGVDGRRVQVLTQGFDARPVPESTLVEFDPARLELLFTGSFYSFRSPEPLLAALESNPRVRLSIATSRWPESLDPWLERLPDQLRLLGFLPHAEAVAAQRAADVLVNIANDDPVHLPGKVFEYLGAQRPILHLGNDSDDAAAVILSQRGCGLHCEQRTDHISAVLQRLVDMKHAGSLDSSFNLQVGGLERYSWNGLARQLRDLLETMRHGDQA